MDEQKVALVTGCGRSLGIGGATARLLARDGVRVVAADIVPEGVADALVDAAAPPGGLKRLVDEITVTGGICSTVLGDVSSEEDVRRMVSEVLDRHGRLDILVNAAGAPQGPEFGDIAEVSLDAWARTLAVNLTGVFLLSREAVRAMRSNGWGRIVNVSSVAAKTGYPQQGAYSASKAGVLGLTRSMALDVARNGINVNAVCPGWIRTNRTHNSARRIDQDVEAVLRQREERVPVGRLGSAEDVATLIRFLASDEAQYITGQAYTVDGGLVPS